MKTKKRAIIGITGCTGLIGSYFIKKYNKYSFDKFKGKIENRSDVKKWINKTKALAIIHLAAKAPTFYVNKNYSKSVNINYNGTKNLISSMVNLNKTNIEWFFFASSSHVYKESKQKLKESSKIKAFTKYGKTKILAEKFLNKISKKTKFKICIGRIFSLTHPTQNISYAIPSIFNKIKFPKKKTIILKDLNHDRDFCHIEDACRAINLLFEKRIMGTYNIGSGKKINLKNIAKYFANNKKIIFKDNKKKTSIIANTNKLKKIGFKRKYNLNRILSEF